MLRSACVLSVLLLPLSGCTDQERVHYWELETTMTFEGPDDGVLLERGPHCAWLEPGGDGLTLRRGWGDPRPDGHVLGRVWSGDRPHGDTTGSGYDWWFGAGAVPATIEGGPDLVRLTWDGDTPALDGERGLDGWNRTVHYTAQGLDVAETLTLRDHGVLPITVRTQRSLTCE